MAQESKQWVKAPEPTFRGPPIVYTSVRVAADEEVQWDWTHTSEGSYVSGFKIVKRNPAK